MLLSFSPPYLCDDYLDEEDEEEEEEWLEESSLSLLWFKFWCMFKSSSSILK